MQEKHQITQVLLLKNVMNFYVYQKIFFTYLIVSFSDLQFNGFCWTKKQEGECKLRQLEKIRLSILFIRPLIFYFITLMLRDHSFKALHQESRGSENYQSTSSNLSQMKSSCNSQRLQEIRKKYDTPTRRELKQIQVRPSYNNGGRELMNSCKHSLIDDKPKGYRIDQYNSKAQPNSPYMKENSKNDEQAVFKKIKEMKESLLCGKGGYDKAKVTKSIYEPSRDVKKNSSGLDDHRIENIDKINSKIQQILSCLKQNESKSQIYERKDRNEKQTPYNKRNARDQPVNTNYSNNTSLQKRSVIFDEPNKSISTKPQISTIKNSSSIYQDEKNSRPVESPARKQVEGFTLEQRRDTSRARSFISSVQKDNNAKYEMSNGKKLDDEISKIQNKIQQFEEQKKRLNIEFKPFTYSNSRSSADLTKRSYTADKSKIYEKKYNYEPPSEKKFEERISALNNRREDYRKVLERERSYSVLNAREGEKKEQKTKDIERSMINIEIPLNTSDNESEKRQEGKSTRNGFQIKLIPVEDEKKFSILNERKSEKSYEYDRNANEQLRKKADEGIENRKKKLNYESKRSSEATKRMIKALKNQTELDEEFRNCKLWLESSSEKDKWDKLRKKLSAHGIEMSEQQVKRIFQITDEENNPFFSVRENGCDHERLIQSYIATQNFWKEEIFHRFERDQLEREGFGEQNLDLQRKGHLVVQDLVRFLNMETGNFYRNRDLFLIMKRINKQFGEKQSMKFGDFINALCRK